MRPKILLVDDAELVLHAFSLQLEAEDFAVATRGNSQQGLAALAEALDQGQRFSLLITDLDMPGDRGTVLIKAVREIEEYDGIAEHDRLPILLLTGQDLSTISEYEQDELMDLGVSYLSKRDATRQLIPTVRSLLRC